MFNALTVDPLVREANTIPRSIVRSSLRVNQAFHHSWIGKLVSEEFGRVNSWILNRRLPHVMVWDEWAFEREALWTNVECMEHPKEKVVTYPLFLDLERVKSKKTPHGAWLKNKFVRLPRGAKSMISVEKQTTRASSSCSSLPNFPLLPETKQLLV